MRWLPSLARLAPAAFLALAAAPYGFAASPAESTHQGDEAYAKRPRRCSHPHDVGGCRGRAHPLRRLV
jgi:hypothetical protein